MNDSQLGRIVLNPPELKTTLCGRWNPQRTHLIGLTAFNQAAGSWRTKNSTCPDENQSAGAPVVVKLGRLWPIWMMRRRVLLVGD